MLNTKKIRAENMKIFLVLEGAKERRKIILHFSYACITAMKSLLAFGGIFGYNKQDTVCIPSIVLKNLLQL